MSYRADYGVRGSIGRLLLVLAFGIVSSGCGPIEKVIENALGKADTVVQGAIASAEHSGSAVVSQAFLQADLLRANVMTDIGRQRESLEQHVQRLMDQVSKTVRCTTGKVDYLMVDLQSILPEVVFWMKGREFFIQAIRNAQLVPSGADSFVVSIVGKGIGGLADDPTATSTEWRIGETPLDKSLVIASAPHVVDLHIPAELLHFDESKVRFIRVSVVHRVTRKKHLRMVTSTYKTFFHVALLPRRAAVVEAVDENLVATVMVPKTLSESFHFGIVNQTSWSRTQTFRLPSNAELAGNPYEYSCTPDPNGPSNGGSYCGWCYPMRFNGYQVDCLSSKTPAGWKIDCLRRCEAGRATIKHVVNYVVPERRGEKGKRTLNMELRFDRPEILTLSDNNTDGNYDLVGRTAAGAAFRLLSAPSSRDDPKLGLYSELEKAGTGYRVVITAKGPEAYSQCP